MSDEEDDVFDREPPAPIARGLRRTEGSFARLSTVIRRSLRLPPRRVSRQADETPLKRTDDTNLPTFSNNATIYIRPSKVASRLDEIQDNKRLNRHEKVKKLLRKGGWSPHHEIRKQLWQLLCMDKDFDSMKIVYESKTIQESGVKLHHPQFVRQEGAVFNNFELNEDGAMRLLKLLSTLENDYPTLTSAPFLYPVCALLLHYMPDTEAYACTQFILKRGFLIRSLKEWYASAFTLLDLLKKHKSATYSLLKARCNTADDSVLVETLRDYLQWIFRGLPLHYVIRIIDCFLVEGQKFIIRAAIAVVYIWGKSQKGHSSERYAGMGQAERIRAVKDEILNFAKTCDVSADTFIETCIRIRNLKSATILEFQEKNEKKVAADVEQKQQRILNFNSTRLFTDVFRSEIIDEEQASYIMQSLPPRLQMRTPDLLFRLSEHGASFVQLWNKIENADQTIVIIRSTKNEIFGAFCSAPWCERNDRHERTKSKYFGTGESFVFKLDSLDLVELPIIYNWIGSRPDAPEKPAQMFMTAGDKLLIVGSGSADAIRISEELTRGMSGPSDTFGNPPLVSGNAFEIHELEVFEVSSAQ